MTAPRTVPPFGLTLPIEIGRVLDGDTVEVCFPGSTRLYKIRLIDCWAPELRQPGGREAKEAAELLIDNADRPVLFVPAPPDASHIVRGLFSFDRILGHIYLTSDKTLADLLIEGGFATAEKVG